MRREAVRAAIIKANPTDPRWNVIRADEEKVRLADVLVALRAIAHEGLGIDTDGLWVIPTKIFKSGWLQAAATYPVWDIYHDDLTQQREECIDFLYSVLHE